MARIPAIAPAMPRSASVFIMPSPIWQHTYPCTISVRDRAAGRIGYTKDATGTSATQMNVIQRNVPTPLKIESIDSLPSL